MEVFEEKIFYFLLWISRGDLFYFGRSSEMIINVEKLLNFFVDWANLIKLVYFEAKVFEINSVQLVFEPSYDFWSKMAQLFN